MTVIGASFAHLAGATLLCLCGAVLTWAWPVRHRARWAGGTDHSTRAGRQVAADPAVVESRHLSVRVSSAGRRLPAIAAAAAAVLPLAVLGFGIGLTVSAPLAALVWRAVVLLTRRLGPRQADEQLALALDLVGAALRSGRPVAVALELGAPAAAGAAAELLRVADLLRLGAAPREAWSGVANGPLAPVARIAVRSETSGVRLAAAVESLAAQVRADLHARGMARAHRAGVLALAPLGACFLPAFVCLGIVPVIVGIAQSAGSAIP